MSFTSESGFSSCLTTFTAGGKLISSSFLTFTTGGDLSSSCLVVVTGGALTFTDETEPFDDLDELDLAIAKS